MTMNSDPIARIYRLGEVLVFGHKLEHCRNEYLDELKNCKHALLLGDGDGRFLCSLLRQAPQIEVDYVELSGKMIAQARSRLVRLDEQMQQRVRFHQADLFEMPLQANSFDLICSHFLLDCLTTEETRRLADVMRHVTKTRALWIVSDFQLPSGRWRRLHARVWVKALYLLFRITTGLRTQRLPSYRSSMQDAGFSLLKNRDRFAGMLTAQLWQRLDILPRTENFTASLE